MKIEETKSQDANEVMNTLVMVRNLDTLAYVNRTKKLPMMPVTATRPKSNRNKMVFSIEDSRSDQPLAGRSAVSPAPSLARSSVDGNIVDVVVLVFERFILATD